MKGARVGKNCNVGDHTFIESGAIVGDSVTIKNCNMIWDGITLEDGVFIGPNVCFSNDLYPRSPRLPQAAWRYEGKGWLSPTLVRVRASIGSGAVIVPGVTIGEFALIGAGAVITKEVLPYALVLGNPARQVGWVCQCGEPLAFDEKISSARCAQCARLYRLEPSPRKGQEELTPRLIVALTQEEPRK